MCQLIMIHDVSFDAHTSQCHFCVNFSRIKYKCALLIVFFIGEHFIVAKKHFFKIAIN